MVSFKIDKQLQTISNYFLFSLAVADLIIGAFSVPLFAVMYIKKSWIFSRCAATNIYFVVSMTVWYLQALLWRLARHWLPGQQRLGVEPHGDLHRPVLLCDQAPLIPGHPHNHQGEVTTTLEIFNGNLPERNITFSLSRFVSTICLKLSHRISTVGNCQAQGQTKT